jgi:hypothetical protein
MVARPKLACDHLSVSRPRWLLLEGPRWLSWVHLSRACVVISHSILYLCVVYEPDVLGIEQMFRESLSAAAARRLMLGSRRLGPVLPRRLY